MVEFQLTAPGDELPVEVLALFREYYRRTADGPWELDKYTYEYLDASHGTRLGYHMHDLGPARHVPHAHCEEAADIPDAERSDHLRAVELDVLEAHAEFMRLWASERAPDCSGYLPLAVPRG